MQALKINLAIIFGTLLEWYDFTLFAYLAPLLAILYFPREDTVAGILAVFAIYSVGNVARAFSAILFGHLGDTKGRQVTLIYSITLMVVPTLLIAITPSYSTIGITSSVLLCIYRFMQGIAIGSEYQGNAIFLIENTQKSQGLAGSWIVTMVGLGILLASVVTTFVTMPGAPDYAWRLAFLFGGLLGLIALYIRNNAKETITFSALKTANKLVKVPVKLLITKYKKHFLLAIITSLGAAGYTYSLIFLPTYFTFTHTLSLHEATRAITISLVLGQFLSPLLGWLSDKQWLNIFRQPTNFLSNKFALMLIGSIGTLVLAYPCYRVYQHGSLLGIIIANLIIGILGCFYLAPKNAVLANLFPANIRYTGFGLAHNLGLAIGGFMPLILTYLITKYHLMMAPAYYLMLSGLMSTVGLLTISLCWNKSGFYEEKI